MYIPAKYLNDSWQSLTKRETEERLSEGTKIIKELFSREGEVVDALLNVAKTLRAMLVVDLEMPTLCLVGAPNVGKSIFGPSTINREA
ncbi:nucleolar GTP-binding 1 isoform X2, partial [Olea europaea subsp. europaea]